MKLSWMFWVAKGINGTNERPPHLLFLELGLPACSQKMLNSTVCSSGVAPDVLVLNVGPWELQDRPPEDFGEQLALLLHILKRHLPDTRVLIIGPLGIHSWCSSCSKDPSLRSWRTQHRALRLMSSIKHAVSLQLNHNPRRLSYMDVAVPFAAIGQRHSLDGTHFLLESVLDLMNMLLNELLDLNWIQRPGSKMIEQRTSDPWHPNSDFVAFS